MSINLAIKGLTMHCSASDFNLSTFKKELSLMEIVNLKTYNLLCVPAFERYGKVKGN